jgi:hypothetical protein
MTPLDELKKTNRSTYILGAIVNVTLFISVGLGTPSGVPAYMTNLFGAEVFDILIFVPLAALLVILLPIPPDLKGWALALPMFGYAIFTVGWFHTTIISLTLIVPLFYFILAYLVATLACLERSRFLLRRYAGIINVGFLVAFLLAPDSPSQLAMGAFGFTSEVILVSTVATSFLIVFVKHLTFFTGVFTLLIPMFYYLYSTLNWLEQGTSNISFIVYGAGLLVIGTLLYVYDKQERA